MPKVTQKAEPDPLFEMPEEPKKPEQEKEEAEDDEKRERKLYVEVVQNDPFFRETSPSVRKMLSYEVWKSLNARLKDLDVGDVVLGMATQEVPIIPDKLVPVFRMLNAGDWDYILSRITKLAPAAIPLRQALMRLAFGLVSLDNIKIPEIVDDDGKVNEERLEHVISQLRRRPLDIVYLLNTHYEWFRSRIHTLLQSGQIKNG